jgi:ATP-dependent Zn protease
MDNNITGIQLDKYKAYHECAHVLTGYLFGQEIVGKISIVPEGDIGGKASYKFRNGDYSNHKTKLFRHIWICMAGQAVCEILTGDIEQKTLSGFDYKDAMKYAQKLLFYYWLEEGDELYKDDIIRYVEREKDRIKEIYKNPALWELIKILADELVEKKEISANEFTEIIKNSGTDLGNLKVHFFFQKPSFNF